LKPPGHAAISLGIGGVLWAVTTSPYSMVAAVITGLMVDVDHLLEYYWWFVKEDHSRVWYLLHSYELVVPAFLAGYLSGWDPMVLGVSLAFLGHLITDQLANPVAPLTYFFTYRALKRFRRRDIVRTEWEELEREFLRTPAARTILGALNPRLKARNSSPDAREPPPA
jgi:hypothetical protein